jgi:hypothetical protein
MEGSVSEDGPHAKPGSTDARIAGRLERLRVGFEAVVGVRKQGRAGAAAGLRRSGERGPLVGAPRPLTQVDQRIRGLLDAQPLGQRGRQEQPRVGDGVGVVEVGVELVEGVGVGDPIEKVPS